jgi:transcriptional regulator
MFTPEIFREDDPAEVAAMIRTIGLATFVTNSDEGLLATPVPMFFAQDEGEFGTLHGHIARANAQWQQSTGGDALAIFQGPNAYITPSWYPAKAETGMVVPTWNYVAVHAYGPVEFYDDPERLLQAVTYLSDRHEAGRQRSWSVNDAPAEFIKAQLRGIVGFRIAIRRIDAKRKMSQNQSVRNRGGAKAGLLESPIENDRVVGRMVRA